MKITLFIYAQKLQDAWLKMLRNKNPILEDRLTDLHCQLDKYIFADNKKNYEKSPAIITTIYRAFCCIKRIL